MLDVEKQLRLGVSITHKRLTTYGWSRKRPTIISHALATVEKMGQENSILGLFNRTSMESYPQEQAYYYLFCRTVASQLLGFDLDYAFGPMIITPKSIPYFLKYNGEYGDLWDSILIPRLRIIKKKLGVTIHPIYFINDSRMTAVESQNPLVILKRIQQFNNVVPPLFAEWQKLNE